jgi:threonine/homoserine/homoserine lactone efflux protein
MSALATGLGAGLVLGVPFGPVGVLALRHAVQGAFADVWALAVGTVLAEAAMAVFVAMAVEPHLSESFASHPSLRFAYAAVLVLMGLAMIARPLGRPSQRRGGRLASLAQGSVMTLLNPGIAAGYLAILIGNRENALQATGVPGLAMGVVIGSGVWWLASVPVLRKLVRMGRPDRISTLVRALGVVFIVIGVGAAIVAAA